MTRPRKERRSGFTLVEMLVSTALIIFVMVILTQVFGYGLQSLRNLRGVGSMQEQLRYAANVMRRDLTSPHFNRENNPLNGPYLSQQRADLYDWTPPKAGFFRIIQGSNSVNEGLDGDGIPSFRAVDHALHFTVRMDMNAAGGTGRDQLFRTRQIPPIFMNGLGSVLPASELDYLNQDQQYCSRWAEIAYFLDTSGQQAGGNPLYTLYRRKRVLLDARTANKDFSLTNPLLVPSAQPGDDERLTDASTVRNPLVSRYFYNTPVDATLPVRRFFNSFTYYQSTAMRKAFQVAFLNAPLGGADPLRDRALVGLAPPGEPQYKSLYTTPLFNTANQQTFLQDNGGDDILLENVLSMEIRVNWDSPNGSNPNAPNYDSRMANYEVFRPMPSGPPLSGPRPGPQFDDPFDILPPSTAAFRNSVLTNSSGPFVFDTWAGTDNYKFIGNGQSPMNMPLRIRVKAIQIRLRVWDIKTQQARQITLVQDL